MTKGFHVEVVGGKYDGFTADGKYLVTSKISQKNIGMITAIIG